MPTKLGKGGTGEQQYNANTGEYIPSGFQKDGKYAYEIRTNNEKKTHYLYGKLEKEFGVENISLGEWGDTLEEAKDKYLKANALRERRDTIRNQLEDKYKDVIASVEKYKEHEDNGFKNYNSQGGYSGYSMSNRAVEAYRSGEKPLSSWNKQNILEELSNIEEFEPMMSDFKKMTLKELKDNFLTNSSWHHTSKFFNTTNFYKLWSPSIIMSSYIDNQVDKIVAKQFTNFGKKE